MHNRDICHECHDMCLDTLVNHCLEQGGAHVEQTHVRLMMDCIQMCQTCADFMHRNSRHSAAVMAACAEICEACAESCEEIGGEEMERCARMCRECAAHCRDHSQRKAA